jgi:PAS domain S-box-containing protein
MAIETDRQSALDLAPLRSLHSLTQAVAAAPGLEGIYDAALKCLNESLGVARASVRLFDSDGVLRFNAWSGLSEDYRLAVERLQPQPPQAAINQPLLVPDVLEDPHLMDSLRDLEKEGIRALAFIPLVTDGRMLGMFSLYYRDQHDFSDEEVLLAQTIATQVAFAIYQHNSRAELLDHQQQYKHLVDSMGVAVFTTDAQGRIAVYNDAAVALWGRHPQVGEDLWGAPLRMYTTSGERLQPQEFPTAIALRENRPVRDVEVVIERPDGTRVNVAPYASPLRDRDGRVTGAVNVMVDVTARSKAESDLGLYREIFENSHDGIAIIDPEGYYRAQNPAHASLIGYADDELNGKTPAVHMGEEGFQTLATELQEHGVYRGEIASTTKDGRPLVLELSAFAVRDTAGRVRYYVGIKRDVTERKQAEEALRRSMVVKDQFLGLVSHELRTPISTILGNGLLLLKREDLIGHEDRLSAYADIVSEATKLQENVEHLLLLTKLESGDVEELPISLPALVTKGVAAFKDQHPGRAMTVECPPEIPPVQGQETLVTLVLQNLLSNAAKYSDEETPIEVRLELQDSGQPTVVVRDYGIGLDEQDLESLFTSFYRSARARHRAAGLGLGLAVCRRVLEAQGGSIGARPCPDRGSEFFFSLPVIHDDGTAWSA